MNFDHRNLQQRDIASAMSHLRLARTYLRSSPKAADAVRRALKSAEGAEGAMRHAICKATPR